MLAVFVTIFALVAAPYLAARIMKLRASWGNAAFVSVVTVGSSQLIALFTRFLGPFRQPIAWMAFVVAWFQVIRIVYGTDIARTVVFMFWQIFFFLLMLSVFGELVSASWISPV